MNKADIRSGNIFAIPLLDDFGFAYIKLLLSADLIPPPKSEVILIKVYNKFEKEISKSTDIDYFESDDILMAPKILSGLPPLRGKLKWIHIGNSSLTEEDKVVPHIHGGFKMGVYDEEYVKHLEENNGIPCTTELGIPGNLTYAQIFARHWNQVRHLGGHIHSSASGIRIQLTFFWMDKLGHKYEITEISEKENIKDWELNWGKNISLSNSFDISNMPKIDRLKMKD